MVTSRNYRLGLLPEPKLNRRALVAAYSIVLFVLLIIINIDLIFPDKLTLNLKYTVTELIPRPDLQPKPLKTKQPQRTLKIQKLLPAVHFETPKLIVPKSIREARKENPDIAPPKVDVNSFKPVVVKTGGARPAQVIYTGAFGSSATPTVNAAVEKVQTGGFGDPNGVKGTGKEGAKLTIAQTGSFDLPSGPGQGNGAGGAKGIKGTVASVGFGNGIAQGGQGDGRSNGRGSVQTSGFGSQELAHGGKTVANIDTGPATKQVEITFKPNPVYTEEARQLRLEGEVLLEVMFGSNGQLHVNRVVRGMGHGLDEAAINAANKMRFNPAQRNGVPVDTTAVVHVVFQLAF